MESVEGNNLSNTRLDLSCSIMSALKLLAADNVGKSYVHCIVDYGGIINVLMKDEMIAIPILWSASAIVILVNNPQAC